MAGSIDDKLSADYAREVLKSFEIPVVITSRSGFFGEIGLPMNPFYSSGSPMFEVSVPSEYKDEAIEFLVSAVGDRFHRKEPN